MFIATIEIRIATYVMSVKYSLGGFISQKLETDKPPPTTAP